MTRAHRPVRTWQRLWLQHLCRCGLNLVYGRCPVDETPVRVGDGDTVPLPRTPVAVAFVNEKTRPLPVLYPQLNFLTRGPEWRANGGRR